MTRVLIVDDKEENLYYLQALLTGHGYTVEVAQHGAEALVRARQNLPDMIVSDLLMPVMDGYTLLRHWKVDTRLKQIPFIVYTATYTEPEDEKLALDLGADAFILKPSEPEDFLARFREVEAKAAKSPNLTNFPVGDEQSLLSSYSETLIRKLEEKTLQLEESNRALQQDIAERIAAEQKVEYLAFYDALTGLPNRRLLYDRLKHTFLAGLRNSKHGAALFIDLDNFKSLNDIKGHKIGDMLLVEMANRLQESVRECDTVARLGGDEFVVILENLSEDLEQAAALAESVGEKILSAINQPCMFEGYEYHSSASLGISLFGQNEMTVDELLKRADNAMYQAKNAGRNTQRFFDPIIQATLEARIALERDLRSALINNQFTLYYQMQVDHSGHIHGAEVLIRWQHPQRGLVPPLEFIPLAEEVGLILPIGRWVLESACAQLKLWAADSSKSHLQLSVNVSALQFHQADFVMQVGQILSQTMISPDRLKLELTESLILDNIDEAIIKMHALKAMGVRFSMDDFGTGYSSLSYLTQLPLDQLKIDQSFVRNIGANKRDAVIVQTIIGMARNLGMEVIAEGVETEDQRVFLQDHGCEFCQGYLFGRPVPLIDFEEKLTQ